MGVQLPLVCLNMDERCAGRDGPKELEARLIVLKGRVRRDVLRSRVRSPVGQVCHGLYEFSPQRIR